ncbi:MAG: PHP domain-containing protein [Myxococcota bacterium]|nr:PHP domain-containing protein [Myxococcota bacterium]
MLKKLFLTSTLLLFILSLGYAAWLKWGIAPYLGYKPPHTPHIHGTFHVHSEASHDSKNTLDSIIRAAKKNNLDFVVVTDHNVDERRPGTKHGVHVIFAPEISTPFGHAIRFPKQSTNTAPPPSNLTHPLFTKENLAQPNSLLIAAHPTLRRNPWIGPWVGLGGMEIASINSNLQNNFGKYLEKSIPAILSYLINPTPFYALLYSQDQKAISRWDDYQKENILGFCAVDAHDWVPLNDILGLWELVIPRAENPEPISPEQIIARINAGKFYCRASRLLNKDSALEFSVSAEEPAHDLKTQFTVKQIKASFTSPPMAGKPPRLVLYRFGIPILTTTDSNLSYKTTEKGRYRVEGQLYLPTITGTHKWITVMYSNKILVH